ncbi:MAG TPA: A/G-specific adenine glycosylase [Flavobacterium sp.]|jgi:A/G-specific adenine glycosylase
MNFTKKLLQWYLQNKRDLPWRDTTDPYLIWLSEIMLQQTRVAQGLPYFLSFRNAFPTVFDLAEADEQQVLKLWQGLGYYSRARNLHQTAQYVAGELGGTFPKSYAELLNLKGVGSYTAAAIASFSYNEAVPVVDGNVFRVLARFFDIETDISQPSTRKYFAALASELMPADNRGGAELSEANSALFNQAIMEFGALQCVPKKPDCSICPLNPACSALQKGKVDILPVNNKKVKVTNRYFNYLVFQDEQQKTIIQKRVDAGIWQNLYEFPLLETLKEESLDMVSESVVSEYEILSITEFNKKSIIHKLSHQHLHIKFWQINVKGSIKNSVDYDELLTYPVPIVLANFMEKHYQ